MPNGGFGCAYCQFYSPGKCNLRGANISIDHWTVCANVTYMKSGPTRVVEYLGYKPLDATGVEIKGSIFSITADLAMYTDVPWLENQEILSTESEFPCSICNKERLPTKYIKWKGAEVYFCSYEHYLNWRDERILSGDAADTPTHSSLLTYAAHFNSLKVIEENTTPEERKRALRRDFWRKTYRRIRKFVIYIFVISIFVRVFNYFF
jgi:hypothetical protein